MPNSIAKTQGFRLVIQLIFLGLSMMGLVLIWAGFSFAIHAVCPYATVCFGLNKEVVLGYVNLMFWASILFGLLILVFSMFYGRKFCGYICPLGTWQEAIFALRKARYRRTHRVPYFYERGLGRIKYIILALTAGLSLAGIGFTFIRLCPFYALSMLPRLAIPGLSVLIIVSIGGFFTERIWCRWLCPFAALLNIFQSLGKQFGIKRSKIRRNLERCVDCGVCMLYCPMNINIAAEEYVQNTECIHCLVCASKCPKKGSLNCEKENS